MKDERELSRLVSELVMETPLLPYAEDTKLALEVAEKEDIIFVKSPWTGAGNYVASVNYVDDHGWAEGDTLALAICRAALDKKGISYE